MCRLRGVKSSDMCSLQNGCRRQSSWNCMEVYRDGLLLRRKQCPSEDPSVCTIVLLSHTETVTVITEHGTMVFSEFIESWYACMTRLK